MIDRLTAALADRYRIEREVGAGGMATVYIAHDIKHDRKVAVKVLRQDLTAAIGVQRFLTEIRTTAGLQHPHIVPLFDSGAVDTTLYYVMPFVNGESLRERIAREPRFPVADAVRIAGEVARALDHAHRSGVVHRDIKPANILLRDGQALVADFGIALASTSANGRITSTGMSIGTPHYMSPEQALGEREVDARSDLYSLAAMLYEMLTGEPPFTGATAAAIVAKVITEKPVSPSRLRPDLPRHVETAILVALNKNPADRMPSAAAFLAALESGPASGGRDGRRGWRTGAAIAVVALLAIAAVWLAPWTRVRHPQPRPVAADTAAQRLVALAENDFSRRDSVGCDRATARYSEAIDKDSTYAAAYAGLAQTRAVCGAFGFGRPRIELAAAKTAIESALRLDSTVANAYTTRGFVHVAYDHDYAAGDRDFRKAIQLDSMQFTPWLYRTWYFVAMNRLDSAVASVRRAKVLAPVSNIVGTRVATVLHFIGDNVAAEKELVEVLGRDSSDVNAHTIRAMIAIETGQCADALRESRWLVHTQSYMAGVVAAAQAACGEPGAARAFVAAGESRIAAGEYFDSYSLAMAHAGLGDTSGVVAALNRAIVDRYPLLFELGTEPLFRSYRADPRYQQLMRLAKLP